MKRKCYDCGGPHRKADCDAPAHVRARYLAAQSQRFGRIAIAFCVAGVVCQIIALIGRLVSP